MIDRERLRRETLRKREALSPTLVRDLSLEAGKNLDRLPGLEETGVIMAYCPVRGEVDVSPFWLKEWERGKTILLPRVRDKILEAVAFRGWEETAPGAFGIMEPLGPAVDREKIEAVIVPGVVFDGRGYRLGYGKGFYDRFLALLPSGALTYGVAYSFQVVDELIPSPFDRRVSWMVTDAGNWRTIS